MMRKNMSTASVYMAKEEWTSYLVRPIAIMAGPTRASLGRAGAIQRHISMVLCSALYFSFSFPEIVLDRFTSPPDTHPSFGGAG